MAQEIRDAEFLAHMQAQCDLRVAGDRFSDLRGDLSAHAIANEDVSQLGLLLLGKPAESVPFDHRF